jgi:hypothetical protein
MNTLSERNNVVKFESPTNLGNCTMLKSVKPIGSERHTGIIVNTKNRAINGNNMK